MKDSITQQFPRVPIKDVAIINPRRFDIPISDDESLSFVPMKDVEEETGRLHTKVVKVWKEVKKGYTPFQEGDVIFAKITPCMENGKFALAMGLHGGRAAGSTEFHVFRPKPTVDPKYLLYYFFTPAIRHAAKANMKGTAGQLRVPISFLEEQEIPLPSIEDQKIIVAEIEKQFTRLDAGVAALKRLQANLKRYRASVLKAACEGKLVPTEAELARKEWREYEPASVLLERILKERREKWQAQYPKKKYVEPKGPDTSNLPELPEGWCWATVEQLTTKVVDGVHKKPNYVISGIPFVTVRNLTAGNGISFENLKYITRDDHKEFIKRANPEKGDILITKDGTLGVVRQVKVDDVFSIFVSVAMIKLVNTGLSNYITIALTSPQVQIQMVPKGSGLQHIHLEDLREDCIPIAPSEEQQRIVLEVERRISVVDEFEATVEEGVKRAERLRQSVLQKVFGGKWYKIIDVSII